MKRSLLVGILTLALVSFGSFAFAQDNTELLKNVQEKLVNATGDSASDVDLSGPQYLLLYFSAHWCPPCRAFTPKLVEFYNANKKDKNFELVFISRDKNEAAMFEYMKETSMPWPAVKFDAVDSTGIRKYCGPGIPCLVLTDAKGTVLADSFKGQDYLGPEQVLEALLAKLQKK